MGMGRGRGQGPRPEEEEDTKTYDARFKPTVGPGVGIVVGEAGGPNYKGKVAQQISEDYETARRGDIDPLTRRRIPKTHRRHTEEYFNRFREGE